MSHDSLSRALARVLIVDDEPEIAAGLAELLSLEGFSAAAVSSGEDALAWLAAYGSPTAVLLDLMMPGISGWDLLARWSQGGAEPLPFPVLILSASGREMRDTAEAYGASACFSKPVDFDGLLAALDALAAEADRRAPRGRLPR